LGHNNHSSQQKAGMDESASKRVNLDEVAHLVEQLERDLARVREGDASVDTLRGEVEQLRQALSTPEPSHGELHEGLHGVRERLGALSDELVGDALKGSDYIARIARILGLG
jgi:DNA repair exonuclease SbcCD ATPase subunit